LILRSLGAPQPIGIAVRGTVRVGQNAHGALVRYDMCITPCTLYVHGGPLALYTGGVGVTIDYRVGPVALASGGDGVAFDYRTIVVPANGARIDLYAGSLRRQRRSYYLVLAGALPLALGIGFALGEGIVAAANGRAYDPVPTLVVSGLTLSLGVALWLAGFLTDAANHAGVARLTPIGAGTE